MGRDYFGFSLCIYIIDLKKFPVSQSVVNFTSPNISTCFIRFINLFSSGKWLFIVLRQNSWWVLLHSWDGSIYLGCVLWSSGKWPNSVPWITEDCWSCQRVFSWCDFSRSTGWSELERAAELDTHCVIQ